MREDDATDRERKPEKQRLFYYMDIIQKKVNNADKAQVKLKHRNDRRESFANLLPTTF